MGPVRIDVWSDIICPWCAIGRARLAKALAQAGVEANVVHRAFELDPSRTATVPTREFLEERYGSEADVEAMTRRVQELGAADGLDLRAGETIAANTFDCHRLLLWAQSQGPQAGAALMDRVVTAHFGDLADLSDHEVLAHAAAEAGLDAEAARRVLESDDFAAEVRADEEAARLLGIHGVPFVLVADRFGVSGAQSVETFVRALGMAVKP